ncbi:MAG: WecB/TagA/CpsF family glycosyltransferase [Bacteroidales bacterium]|nr:WecB/TagA/CpsF family glycosyltransferase [Bacteroidales bacterium]
MAEYFHINYNFDSTAVLFELDKQITKDESSYICVADGNILQLVHRDVKYRQVVNGSVFSICDSSWVPMFLKWIYGIRVCQYCGSQIFHDILCRRKYRMFFMGSSKKLLNVLQEKLSTEYDSRIRDMQFYELPFCEVEDFDYPAIARKVNEDCPDIIWVALGAPKQEIFMARLKPYLNRGVMIAVGAVFKFYSGVAEKRAPQWIIKNHMEFMYRLFLDPKKQLRRCWAIGTALPEVLWDECRRKHCGV